MTPTLTDIRDQAVSWTTTLDRVDALGAATLPADRPWVFVGSGASFYAAQAAAGLLRALGHDRAVATPASEAWMSPEMWIPDGSVLVGLSRSGTTTETVQALRAGRRRGAGTVGITLTAGTPVALDPDHAVVLDHVGEIGRVMTRSFANLMLAAQSLAVASVRAADTGRVDGQLYAAGLADLADQFSGHRDGIDGAARTVGRQAWTSLVLLGSGPGLAIARQGALQLQETSRLSAEAYSVLEYRHGPIARLGEDTLVVVLTSERSVAADLLIAGDVALLGGSLVACGEPGVLARFGPGTTTVVTSTGLPRWLQAEAALPFLQLLAYHRTDALGDTSESVHNLDRSIDPHINPHAIADDLFGGGVPVPGGTDEVAHP